ncbi:ig-like domain-containing protein [Caerostris extrusa]|uniref:Ig-like domain-containing protein n=1 Tax=Caerostris extrusa TaxID=172846 RepID=A0AAV4XTH4_CAEEX|nr:ig-like domain-containing protein [Caerostris extrusa]
MVTYIFVEGDLVVFEKINRKKCLIEDFPDYGEPIIVMGPSNTTAMMGDIVVFTCDTTGDPPPQVSWQRNGRNIHINGHSSYKILDSGSLQLDSGAGRLRSLSLLGKEREGDCQFRDSASASRRYLLLLVLFPLP